jgi:hypothetical protein
MTRRTAGQMFGKVARDLAAAERARREDEADAQRQEREAEERLNEPLRRRDVLDAIEQVKYHYSEYHHSGTIELLDRLTEALK